MACIYTIGKIEYTESEFKKYLEENLKDHIARKDIVLSKTKENIPPKPPVEEEVTKGERIVKRELSDEGQRQNTKTITSDESQRRANAEIEDRMQEKGLSRSDAMQSLINDIYNEHFDANGNLKKDLNPTTQQIVLTQLNYERIKKEEAKFHDNYNPRDLEDNARYKALEEQLNKTHKVIAADEWGRAGKQRQAYVSTDENGNAKFMFKKISDAIGQKLPTSDAEMQALRDENSALAKKVEVLYKDFQDYKKSQKEVTKKSKENQIAISEEKVKKQIAKERKKAITEIGKNIVERNKKKVGEEYDRIFESAKRDMVAERVKKEVTKNGGDIDKAVDVVAKEGLIKSENIQKAKDYFKELANENDSEQKLKDISADTGETGITQEMVDNGIIKNYVHSFLDKGVAPEDAITEAHKGLKKLGFDVERSDVRDAYLKQGDYKPETKERLQTKAKRDQETLKSITKLERDIEILQSGDDFKNLSKEEKQKAINSVEEKYKAEKQKLIDEKKAIEQERKDAEKANKKAIPKDKTLEQVQNDLDKRLAKLKEVEDKIKALDEDNKLWNRSIKEPSKKDLILSQAREKLRKLTLANGRRLEYGDADSREAKNEVINAHNKEIDNLKKNIYDKILDESTSDEERNSLRDLHSKLDDLKIDNKTETAENISDKIDRGIDAVKKAIKDNPDHKQELTDILHQLQVNNKGALADIRLARAKRDLQTQIEQTQRKLASGKYEDTPPSDFERDAEWAELNVERKKLDRQLQKKVDDWKLKNKGAIYKTGHWITRTQVAHLISGFSTQGRIFVSSFVKPIGETISRTVTRPVMNLLPAYKSLNTSREMLNGKATMKGFVDSFKGMSEKQLKAEIDANNKAFEVAHDNLQNAHDTLKQIGKEKGLGSPEYKAYEQKELADAQSEYKIAQINQYKNMVYNFLSANPYKDRAQIIKYGSTKFEESQGGYMQKKWGDEKTAYGKYYIYPVEMLTHAHGAMKDLSARQAFMEGWMKRLDKLQNSDKPISEADISMALYEAYNLDYLGGKYQQSEGLAKAIRGLQASGIDSDNSFYQILGWTSKVFSPVLKIGLNIAKEKLAYEFGAVGAPIKLGYEVNKVRQTKVGEQRKLSYENFKKMVSEIPTEQADLISRLASKGMFGAAIAILGITQAANGNLQFGGFYEDKKQKRKNTLSGNKMEFGHFYWKGNDMGKFTSGTMSHLPLLSSMLFPAIVHSAYAEEYSEAKNNKADAYGEATKEMFKSIYHDSGLNQMLDPNPINSLTTIGYAKSVADAISPDNRDKSTLLHRVEQNTGFFKGLAPKTNKYE